MREVSQIGSYPNRICFFLVISHDRMLPTLAAVHEMFLPVVADSVHNGMTGAQVIAIVTVREIVVVIAAHDTRYVI
jgi:hypothetical protein